MIISKSKSILLLILSFALAFTIPLWYAHSTSAPTRNSICEPGGCATSTGGCTDDVFLDGTTPIDHPTTGAANIVGTAGQDFTVFLTSIVANGRSYCFEPGTYVQKTQFVLNNGNSITFTGLLGKTIFQQGSASNVQSMIDLTGTSTNQILLQDITFDFNKAAQGAYTCPNSGWIIQNVADTGQALPSSSNKVSILNNEFENSACQAIEWISTDGMIIGNYFHDVHEGIFLTGLQTQRVVVSNNIVVTTDTTGPNNSGMDVEDRAQNITITGNVFKGPGSGTGVDIEPGNMTSVTANSISSFNVGVLISGPGAIGSVFNTIGSNVITNCLFDGIKVNHASEQGTIITDNTLRDNGGGSTDQTQIFIVSSGPDLVISSNSIIDTRAGAARAIYAIWVQSTNQVDIIGNVIDGFKSQGIRIESSNYVTVANNKMVSSGFNGLVIAGTSNFGLFVNNDVQQATPMLVNTQTGNIYKGNIGYNPIGKVTNFINAAFMGICGTGTTVVSATVYVVCGTDIIWTCTGGTVTAIVEKDNAGNQIFSVANCAALPTIGVFTPQGYSITFTHTGAPTVSVYAI